MTDTEATSLKKDQNEKKMSSFITRLISGIVLMILAIVLLVHGGLPLFLAAYIISTTGLFELYRILGMHKTSLGCIGYITTSAYYLLL
jgi:phosphatidate cytidylyltransferase